MLGRKERRHLRSEELEDEKRGRGMRGVWRWEEGERGSQRGENEKKKIEGERNIENEKRDALSHFSAFQFTRHIFMEQCLGSMEE